MRGPTAGRLSNPQKKWVRYGLIWSDLVGFGWINLDPCLIAPGSINAMQRLKFQRTGCLQACIRNGGPAWRLSCLPTGSAISNANCVSIIAQYITLCKVYSQPDRARLRPSLVHAFQVSSFAPVPRTCYWGAERTRRHPLPSLPGVDMCTVMAYTIGNLEGGSRP